MPLKVSTHAETPTSTATSRKIGGKASFHSFPPCIKLNKRAVLQTLPQALPLSQDSEDGYSLLVGTLVSVPFSIFALNADICLVRPSVFQQCPHLELQAASASEGTASVVLASIQQPPRRRRRL